MNLHLVALDCPACGSAMSGGGNDVIFFCSHCGSAALLEINGLEIMESTALLPSPGRQAKVWKPAWLIKAEVSVDERVRHGGRRSDGWRGEKTFVVPAFPIPLVDLVMLARALSEAAGGVGEVPREPIRGGTLAYEDALVLARHMVVGDEARKPDKLASVEVEITEKSHRLAAIPFEEAGDGRLKCAITGVVVSPVVD